MSAENPEWETWREAVDMLLDLDDAGRTDLEGELIAK
jgi:hypothetical protein